MIMARVVVGFDDGCSHFITAFGISTTGTVAVAVAGGTKTSMEMMMVMVLLVVMVCCRQLPVMRALFFCPD